MTRHPFASSAALLAFLALAAPVAGQSIPTQVPSQTPGVRPPQGMPPQAAPPGAPPGMPQGMPQGMPSGREPPPQAFDDCKGKRAGEAIQHKTPQGMVAAKCMEGPKGLFARPDQPPPGMPPGMPPRSPQGGPPKLPSPG